MISQTGVSEVSGWGNLRTITLGSQFSNARTLRIVVGVFVANVCYQAWTLYHGWGIIGEPLWHYEDTVIPDSRTCLLVSEGCRIRQSILTGRWTD